MSEPSSNTPDRGSFDVEPHPRWVTGFDKAPPTGSAAKSDSSASPLLIDHQLFPKTGKHYLRQAQRIDSAAGAESLSQLSLDFDPRIESLSVHSIRVWRDGVPREEAATESFKIAELEPTPERQRYDPRQSARLHIDDVRPGDVIDIAATRTSLPAASAGKFHCLLSANQTSTVARWSASVISGENSALRWQATPHFEAPDERQLKDGWVLRRWCNEDMQPSGEDDNTPGWHRTGAAIEFSDFADWSQVANWATEAWQGDSTSESERELAEHIVIECAEGDVAARADMALDFIRDEIRYIDNDCNLIPLRPNPTEYIIKYGIADRKDNASLLCDILSLLEIEATPVLVNTVATQALAQMLPSPAAFDHVIVKARIGGADVWIDPTQARLAKSATDAPPPAFAFGLLLATETSDLETIPPTPADAALLVVRENYTIGHHNQPTTLQIECEASGTDAQQLRQILSETGSDAYFQGREAKIVDAFPGARANGEASVSDPADADKLVIREGYEIDDIAPNKEGQPRTIAFEPSSISSRFPGAPTEGRRAPWSLPYPCRIRHEFTFELPFEPQPKADHSEIDTPAFGFNSKIETNGKTVTALFRYWSKTDHVNPGDFANFRNPVLQMATASSQLLDVARKRRKSKGHSKKLEEHKQPRQHMGHSEPQKINFKAIAAVAVGAALVAWLAFGMLSGKNDAPPPRVSERPAAPLSESALPTPEDTAADFLKETPTAGNLGDAFDEEFSASGKKKDEFDGINFDGSLLDDKGGTGEDKRGIQKVGDRELLDLDLRP